MFMSDPVFDSLPLIQKIFLWFLFILVCLVLFLFLVFLLSCLVYGVRVFLSNYDNPFKYFISWFYNGLADALWRPITDVYPFGF